MARIYRGPAGGRKGRGLGKHGEKRQQPPHPNQEALNAQRAAASEHLRKVLSDAVKKLKDAKAPS